MSNIEYSRLELIALCERAIVPEKKWADRDSKKTQAQVGECWALLKAGCKFKVLIEGDPKTDGNTIWVEIRSEGFHAFECRGDDGDYQDRDTFYLPTEARLGKAVDWY